MPSDLESPAPREEEVAPKKAAEQILRHEIQEGLEALEKSAGVLFVSALSGGLDVGFSLFLMAVVLTRTQDRFPQPLVQILVANMYSVGFIFVVVGRSELFTEQTSLAVLPVLRGSASVRSLGRLWAIVYAGNVIGAAAFAVAIAHVAPLLGVAEPSSFGAIAHLAVDHGASAIFFSALLAGWLMGLLSWMVSATRDTISQIVLVWLVTTVIGYGGLHHVVLGTVEVMAGVASNQGVSLGDFGHFLLWTTLGNALGGSFFVALIKYGHAHPSEKSG